MSDFTEELKFHPRPIQVTPIKSKEYTFLSEKYYRPNTTAERVDVNFLFYSGGIGDYICWMSSILWILETQPQVNVKLYVQSFMLEIARKLFEGKYKNRFVCQDIQVLVNVDLAKIGFTYQPVMHPVSAIGMNLTDLGFCYFANITPEGKYREHIRLDVSDVENPVKEKSYAVVTTGHTTDAREWRAAGVNGVAAHLKSLGITPVFLGKKEVYVVKTQGQDVNYTANFSKNIDYSLGLDLREKTTLLEAAKIMSEAKLVIGLDNGLLHLAGTQDVPIIFGLNIAKPAEREIRRPLGSGTVRYLTPDPKILTCTFCQSNMRFNGTQDFKFCYYKDYVCLDLFADPKPWIDEINSVLGV